MTFSGYIEYDTSNNMKHLEDVSTNPLHTGFFYFWDGIRACWQQHGNSCGGIFTKFSRHVGYETMNNLVHFNDVAVNPWDPGLIFLCLGPCPLKHYGETGQWIFLRFSWYIGQHTKKQREDFHRQHWLFHGPQTKNCVMFATNTMWSMPPLNSGTPKTYKQTYSMTILAVKVSQTPVTYMCKIGHRAILRGASQAYRSLCN